MALLRVFNLNIWQISLNNSPKSLFLYQQTLFLTILIRKLIKVNGETSKEQTRIKGT